MVVLIDVVDTKTNYHPVQETLVTIGLPPFIEVLTGVENKLVLTGNQVFALQQRVFTSAIRVCRGMGYGIALTDAKQLDVNRGSGAAIGGIKYMCR